MDVYFDNAATTPMLPEVIEAISESMQSCFGNPSSTHGFGRTAKSNIESARKSIAGLLGAQAQEIIFTSGGTESDNMILRCAVKDLGVKTIISSKIEHHAVLHTLDALKASGVQINYVKLTPVGSIDLKDLEKLLSNKKINFIEEGNDRNYIAKLSNNDDILIYFMGAKEIVTQLDEGNIHLGVTGDDLIQEYMFDYKTKVSNELILDFGKADLVVAVPKIWLDVTTMADLDEISHIKRMSTAKRLKVATKYTNLTNRFFSKCGVTDYRTVGSSGSTESAPFNGMSDIIVDISSTGETLKANNLRILDDGLILNSSANIFKSLTANWNTNLEKISEQFLSSVS